MSLSDDGQFSTPSPPEDDRKERLESLGLVAGGIAHDFNNLLVGILGNAELLLGSIPADSPLAGPVRAILTSAERAAEHTRELLDYAGRGLGQPTPVELGALVANVAQVTAPLGGAVTLACELPDAPVWAEADQGQLTRMLVNLVKNGLEAMSGRRGEVRLALDIEDDAARLTVRDAGTGMDEATRARIFDPFFSTKQTGHGLGLASVQSIVRRHRGSIRVDTAPGQGATFTVHLPRSSPPNPAALTRLATPEPPRHGSILVVDDDATVRETGVALLEELGFSVAEAHDGPSALVALVEASAPFDAVLLDATMPGMTASETLRTLRARFPALPILLCSGYAQSDFAELLECESHIAFLAKPYRTSELVRMLARLLA
jgi:CheY-like chemotaxis protein